MESKPRKQYKDSIKIREVERRREKMLEEVEEKLYPLHWDLNPIRETEKERVKSQTRDEPSRNGGNVVGGERGGELPEKPMLQ